MTFDIVAIISVSGNANISGCDMIVQSIVDKLNFINTKGLPKIDFGRLADYADIS